MGRMKSLKLKLKRRILESQSKKWMHEIMCSLVEEAFASAIDEVQAGVGLQIVPTEEWISLYGVNSQLLARIPRTEDPIGDINHIRSVWFQDARKLSNECWD